MCNLKIRKKFQKYLQKNSQKISKKIQKKLQKFANFFWKISKKFAKFCKRSTVYSICKNSQKICKSSTVCLISALRELISFFFLIFKNFVSPMAMPGLNGLFILWAVVIGVAFVVFLSRYLYSNRKLLYLAIRLMIFNILIRLLQFFTALKKTGILTCKYLYNNQKSIYLAIRLIIFKKSLTSHKMFGYVKEDDTLVYEMFNI